jgi:hypothetical protein
MNDTIRDDIGTNGNDFYIMMMTVKTEYRHFEDI